MFIIFLHLCLTLSPSVSILTCPCGLNLITLSLSSFYILFVLLSEIFTSLSLSLSLFLKVHSLCLKLHNLKSVKYNLMVSAEITEAKMVFTTEPALTGPRISFSADLSSSDSEGDYICINPAEKDKNLMKAGDFEFLSENVTNTQTMISADELFSEGKLLPFWQVKQLNNITLKPNEEDRKTAKPAAAETEEEEVVVKHKEQEVNNNRGSWFLDDDPSPRPPTCTVLWKELLRLKKQRTTTQPSSTRASTLSPSSSSSSTSSSSSSIADAVKKEEKEKEGKRGKKGLERTRSLTMRIRPMIHVPVCVPSKSNAPLPPLFPLRLQKNRVERRT